MKKFILILVGFLMLALLNACPFGPCACGDPYHRVSLFIDLEGITDIRVKTIKITLENLGGRDQYEIRPKEKLNGRYRELSEIGVYTMIIERKKYKDKVYFSLASIHFMGLYEETKGKKHTYEFKMYVNDTLFFTKKFSFTPTSHSRSDIEFDNMEYVLKNVGIKITDADVKKWLEKKK